MHELGAAFEERLLEIEEYLAFLQAVETEARSGPPKLGSQGVTITAQQQRILYSVVFLQLYNLVEATVTKCLDAVTAAAMKSRAWSPGDLTVQLRKEWVRVTAKTHADLNYESRLEAVLGLCDHLVGALPVPEFKFEKSGGSWDDSMIEDITKRLGFQLRVRRRTYQEIKRPFKDGLGALAIVKKLRNSLAHGSISFAECGADLEVSLLRDLTRRTTNYLREVVTAFTTFINEHLYVLPEKRPVAGGA